MRFRCLKSSTLMCEREHADGIQTWVVGKHSLLSRHGIVHLESRGFHLLVPTKSSCLSLVFGVPFRYDRQVRYTLLRLVGNNETNHQWTCFYSQGRLDSSRSQTSEWYFRLIHQINLQFYSRWKLADFSFTSGALQSDKAYTSTAGRGTSGYRAPELLNQTIRTARKYSDMWSLGCMFYVHRNFQPITLPQLGNWIYLSDTPTQRRLSNWGILILMMALCLSTDPRPIIATNLSCFPRPLS